MYGQDGSEVQWGFEVSLSLVFKDSCATEVIVLLLLLIAQERH